MNVDSAAGNNKTPTGLKYFSQQIFNATIHITDHKNNRSLKSPGVAMLADTGATTTLHNTQNGPQPLPTKYPEFITWDNSDQNAGNLKDRLTFELSARTTSGRTARFFKFKTTSVCRLRSCLAGGRPEVSKSDHDREPTVPCLNGSRAPYRGQAVIAAGCCEKKVLFAELVHSHTVVRLDWTCETSASGSLIPLLTLASAFR